MNNWSSMTISETIKDLDSKIDGLTVNEAKKRLEKDGKNSLPKNKSNSIFKIFINQFKNPIVYILLITIILSFIIGEYFDALFVILVILLDVTVGTIQEYSAEKNALSLQKLIKMNVIVLREGYEKVIDSEDLVVGDIILITSGDKVPADIRLIEANNLSISEAILTGESNAVEKSDEVIKNSEYYSKNILYAGTSVLRGRAKGIVFATAINTEIGKITKKVLSTDETKSPLIIKMENFTKQISVFIAMISIILVFVLYFRGYASKDIFFLVVALAVSAIPEGLPVVLTLALSIASNRMSKKNVLVKKLNSVESLGSCTIIASDKTGTLTVNEQTAKIIVLPNEEEFLIDGTGYNGIGKININDSKNEDLLIEIAKLGVINNEAKLELKNKEWISSGDSIDIAFLALGYKLDITKKNIDINILDNIPYESIQKHSAVFYEENNKKYCTVKGSLEKILEFSDTMQCNNEIIPINKNFLLKQNEKLAKDGYRVMAIAKGRVTSKKEYLIGDIPKLTLIGLIGFIDPIRKEAISAIDKCQMAGIKTVMITGDHPLTAFNIAKELNIANDYNQVALEEELEDALKKGKKHFDNFIKEKLVFARVTPILKYEIVESYKRQGEYVAVTGDGVNDAPALKSANIGVAMGSGTNVAKETSTMIITNDDFSSIVLGIEEGRNAYSNIRKVIYMLLSSGVSEILLFFLSIIFNYPIPLVAIQLLWLNLVTDGIQDAALAFEKGEKDVMKRKPKNTYDRIFDKLLTQEVLLSGFVTGLIVFLLWVYLLKSDVSLVTARSYIVLLMVFMQNLHVLNCRSETKSIFKIPFNNNRFVIISIIITLILQFIVTESTILSNILKIKTIPIIDVFKVFALALPIIIIMEIYKFFVRKRQGLN